MIIQDTELDPKHQALWKRALVSAERKNWQYVVDQMLPVVTANPGFLDGRKLLRNAEEKIAGSMGRRGFSLPAGLFRAASKRPPLEQLNEMEQKVFPKDPFSTGANEQMFDISANIEFPELGAFALETIRRGHPEDTKNMHKLARHYRDCGQPDKAGEVYAAILQVDPRDVDAAKGGKDAAAMASMQRNWEGKNFAEIIKSPDDAGDSEDRNRQGMTRAQMEQHLARLVARYEADKSDVNTVRQMAETYQMLGQVETALMFFDYALTLNPADIALQHEVEKLRDRVQADKLAAFEHEIEASPDAPDVAEKRARLAEIRREHAEAAIGNAKIRVDRNPSDKMLRYELAEAYYNAGQFKQAIPELQQARTSPHTRGKAVLMLGRCFARRKMNDLAQECLQELASELAVMDELKKEVLYELAGVLEAMGDRAASLKALKQIYNADYGYRDVADRVEASYD